MGGRRGGDGVVCDVVWCSSWTTSTSRVNGRATDGWRDDRVAERVEEGNNNNDKGNKWQ